MAQQGFGKYNPPEITFGNGIAECISASPSRYSGMFKANFYDSNGKHIDYPKTHFEQLAIMRGEYYGTYTRQIKLLLDDYCITHIKPNCTDEDYNVYEHGFEDETGDYVICFTTETPVTKSPPTLLTTDIGKFTIVWEYSEIEPFYSEEETYDY